MSKSDDERMREVDAKVIHQPQPDRSKRNDESGRRYLRSKDHHNLMLPACSCDRSPSRPGSICLLCEGAVLTGEEKKVRN